MGLYCNGKPIAICNTLNAEKIIDITKYANSGYSGTNQQRYGSNINLYDEPVELAGRSIYYKTFSTSASDGASLLFGCFDSSDNFLGLATSLTGFKTTVLSNGYAANGVFFHDEVMGDIKGYTYRKVTFPSNVHSVQIALSANYRTTINSEYFCVGFHQFKSIMQTWDDYCDVPTTEFKTSVQESLLNEAPSVCFIGDSLTNWGGGNVLEDGFIKLIAEKIGIVGSNRGLAGAQWQDASGQTQSGVQRVDTLISNNESFDMYVFILGTNGFSETDTGTTSANHSTDMCGGMRYCMEKLKEYEPTKPILVCLPPQRSEGNANQERANSVIKSIAGYYSVPTVDIYHDSGIVPNDVVNGAWLSDGLHLNENGKVAFANIIASKIKEILCI